MALYIPSSQTFLSNFHPNSNLWVFWLALTQDTYDQKIVFVSSQTYMDLWQISMKSTEEYFHMWNNLERIYYMRNCATGSQYTEKSDPINLTIMFISKGSTLPIFYSLMVLQKKPMANSVFWIPLSNPNTKMTKTTKMHYMLGNQVNHNVIKTRDSADICFSFTCSGTTRKISVEWSWEKWQLGRLFLPHKPPNSVLEKQIQNILCIIFQVQKIYFYFIMSHYAFK